VIVSAHTRQPTLNLNSRPSAAGSKETPGTLGKPLTLTSEHKTVKCTGHVWTEPSLVIMGHKSRFSFPVPGRRSKQTGASANSNTGSTPLTKAERILGHGVVMDKPAASYLEPARQPWDAGSRISIAISESSTTHATSYETGLSAVGEDDFAVGSAQEHGWDVESDIIPRHMHSARGLRGQRSAATIGNDCRTDASSLRRRESNASTILTHYDPTKVPLSISQQTSNSAMAKGLPRKASSLLDVDGALSGPPTRKKPARLDFSILKPKSRSRKHKQMQGEVSGTGYAMASSSNLHMPPMTPDSGPNTPRSYPSQGPADARVTVTPSHAASAASVHQLYDHYERMSLRSAHSPDREYPESRRFGSISEEPTPPLTTATTPITPVVIPLSHNLPASRGERSGRNGPMSHHRKGSASSRHTARSSHTQNPMPQAPSYRLSVGKDYASSISSRNTRTSKASRNIDSDLQLNSVLSLTDSESDEETFSDSAPKSSMSSHTNHSHEDVSALPVARLGSMSQPPVIQERVSSKSKQAGFAPLNDYLAIPSSAGKGHPTRALSNSTARSQHSTASTATATGDSVPKSAHGSRGSVSTVGSDFSGVAPHRPGQHGNGIQEAKAVALAPLASTVEALNTLSEMVRQSSAGHHSRHNSEQLTPPLSPASAEFHTHSPGRKDDMTPVAVNPQNARLMAVTKQEEMLLAALRQKRARMRENILAELENSKNAAAGVQTSSADERRNSQKQARSPAPVDQWSATGPAPQLPPLPSRGSSLVTSLQDLTFKDGTALEQRQSRQRSASALDHRSPSAFGSPRASVSRSHGSPLERRSRSALGRAAPMDGRVEAYSSRATQRLEKQIDDFAPLALLEPSPEARKYVEDYGQDSDEEIVPETRSMRYNTSLKSSTSSTSSAKTSAPTKSRRPSDRPRSDSRRPILLENLPESNLEHTDESEVDFDGFSDVMSAAGRSDRNNVPKSRGIARPDSPVDPLAPPTMPKAKGHIRGKKSAVRLSAVGQAAFMLPEADCWGDDG
jgi:hypothetical protein